MTKLTLKAIHKLASDIGFTVCSEADGLTIALPTGEKFTVEEYGYHGFLYIRKKQFCESPHNCKLTSIQQASKHLNDIWEFYTSEDD